VKSRRRARTADEEREARALRRLLTSLYSTESYGLVLVMLIVTYAAAASATGRSGRSIVLLLQVITVALALRTSRVHRIFLAISRVLLVLATLGAIVNLFAESDDRILAFVFIVGSVLYVIAPFSIVRHIGYQQGVDQETMLGALAAYLFIGMAFAFMYRFLAVAQSTPFFGASGDGSLSEDLFFSFVTLTTTGYGNLVPAHNPGQSFAVLEALLGQLFLVTAVAKIVNAWRPKSWRTEDNGSPPAPPAAPPQPASGTPSADETAPRDRDDG
jgi:hypothetical protein